MSAAKSRAVVSRNATVVAQAIVIIAYCNVAHGVAVGWGK